MEIETKLTVKSSAALQEEVDKELKADAQKKKKSVAELLEEKNENTG